MTSRGLRYLQILQYPCGKPKDEGFEEVWVYHTTVSYLLADLFPCCSLHRIESQTAALPVMGKMMVRFGQN